MICSAAPFIVRGVEHDLESPGGRLKAARMKAGYDDAADFARAVGVKAVTYRAHEGGQNGFAKYADQYGAKLKVSPTWLLYGTGQARGDSRADIWLPRPATIAVLLKGVARALSASRSSKDELQAVAVDLVTALWQIAERPDRENMPEVLELMADQIAGSDGPPPHGKPSQESRK